MCEQDSRANCFTDHQCCVCLEEMKDPRGLPCLHVLCLSCLKRLSEQNQRCPQEMAFRPFEMSCPICRHQFVINRDHIDKFPPPKACKTCGGYIANVMELSCGHLNKDTCCKCLSTDKECGVQCPNCGRKSSKTKARKMYLCNACHGFYSGKCNTCSASLARPNFQFEMYRHLFSDSSCPYLDDNRTWILSLVVIGTALLLVFGIVLTLEIFRRGTPTDANSSNIVCCSITVWHVDSWGNVDTSWCSGDDWKLTNAKCAMWPQAL